MRLLTLTAAVTLASIRAANNGLARKPTLGVNLWNTLFCNYNETDLREIAALVVSDGYLAAGYAQFNLDDCWQSSRNSSGGIVPDGSKFPGSDLRPFIAYVKSLGLRFGLYSDAGTATCGGRPGGMGHEVMDAATYAEWGVQYLKYDNCNNQNVDPHTRYVAMANALNATGVPIEFSACIWGVSDAWEWISPYANSARIDDDIGASWDSLIRCTDASHGLSRFASPGYWNDLDMLQVGNFKDQHADAEGRAHFALWALMKSPLLIGTDLRKASAATKATLQAAEIIAVSQDDLGVAGDLVWQEGAKRVYAGPLADGSRAVVAWNLHHYGDQFATDNYTIPFDIIGFTNTTKATVRDMYARSDLGEFTGGYPAAVPLHGVLALRVTPVAVEERDTTWRPWHATSRRS